jgi:dipeptidyl aminopeptidase/acylaminoacyl peptidase
MNSITDTAKIPSGIIADGYLLDVTRFGLPWVLRCDRSPDGQRLAFNTGTDEIAPADDSLQWLNLKDPQSIYQPLTGFHATSFAFSPDSKKLAVFGQGNGKWKRGIYLLYIGTGKRHFLISLARADSLVWSPDGEYLALVGSPKEEDEPSVIVVHVDTGQIAYRGEVEFQEGMSYMIRPIAGWGVVFPVERGGMEECAFPP